MEIAIFTLLKILLGLCVLWVVLTIVIEILNIIESVKRWKRNKK